MSSPRTFGIADVHMGGNYTADEEEFIKAMEAYQRLTGKRFPAYTDVLGVAKSLGYRKDSSPQELSGGCC